MNINIIEDSILSGLADKIRENLGVADTFLPSAMPGKIGEISAGEGVYAWKRISTEPAFDSFVVDDDPTAYPESGVHTDGYTYERIKKKILMYVWHKYQKKSTSISGKVNVAINMIVNGSGGSCTITTTNGLDPSKITDSTFYGAELYYADPSSSIFDMKIILNSDHTTTHYIKSSSNNYAWQATPPNGNNIWDLNGTTLIVAISAGINSAYTFTYSKTVTQTTTVNSFMEEVMSENRNAYPDSISIKHTDGYYYEYKEERVVDS